ncbi:hypothetical protein BJ170DRAFT_681924 [Xylariales sp. AK1849]|nr:hypothetical protein BJ170DRAFT_681924 [Xylariales sp. AK1849]
MSGALSYADIQCANGTWRVPPYSDFNTTHDCALFADFAASILRNGRHRDPMMSDDLSFCTAPIQTAEDYIADALAVDSRPSSCQFLQWYYGNDSFCSQADASYSGIVNKGVVPENARLEYRLMFEPRRPCNSELRGALGLSGNPDLAGIGVMISYSIEALLATAYVAVYAFASRKRRHKSRSLSSLVNASKGTMQTFYFSAIILSFAMVIGAFIAYFTRPDEEKLEVQWAQGEDVSVYEEPLLELACSFSAFPVILAHLMLKRYRRRRRLRLWLSMSLFAACVSLVLVVSLGDVKGINLKDLFRNEPDIVLSGLIYVESQVIVNGIALLMLLTPLVIGFVGLFIWWWQKGAQDGHKHRRTWNDYKGAMLLLINLGSLLFMWATLVLLFIIRTAGIADSGGGDTAETEWSFGQVLALATWVPVGIKFAYIASFGMKEGLEGHMPDDYDAVYNANAEGGVIGPDISLGAGAIEINTHSYAPMESDVDMPERIYNE